MILDPDLDLEPDVHFRMAQDGDCPYPCTYAFNGVECRDAWASGHCPGASLNEKQCVTDPIHLLEKINGGKCLSGILAEMLKPYRDAGSQDHPRVLLYRYMSEHGPDEVHERRAASA